jgi:hypothetical protein
VPYTLSRLAALCRVIVFRAWPFLPSYPNYDVKRISLLQHTRETVRVSTAEFRKHSELINEVLDKIHLSDVQFFDPAAMICDPQYCSSFVQGVKVYADFYHISTAGSLMFQSEIENLLRIP